jgi:hypothetical protein
MDAGAVTAEAEGELVVGRMGGGGRVLWEKVVSTSRDLYSIRDTELRLPL